MRKSILRLCVCAVLLISLVFLAKLIHNKVDSFVASRSSIKETSVSIPTGPGASAAPSKTPTESTMDLTDLSDKNQQSANQEDTQPTDPTGPSDPTAPTTDTTAPTTNTTAPTTNTTAPTTNTTAPTTSTTAPTTGTTVPTTAPTTVPTTTTMPKGQLAPAITFYDAAGNAYTIDAYKDKPIIICFWASWATGSGPTLEMLKQCHAEYGEDIYFLAINITDGIRETRELADAFLADKSYPFPVFYDLDGVCRSAYGVNTKPTTFFIQKENWAIAYFKGNLSTMGLNRGLQTILPKEE